MTRDDVKYIGQHQDDLQEIIDQIEASRPEHKIILSGHSMGGGIALRYALKSDARSPDGYLLFAPSFGEGPTQKSRGDGDGHPILKFNTASDPLSYSYRAVMSGQPIRPKTSNIALQSIHVPLMVLIEANDEVFNASAYPQFVATNGDGQVHRIEGASHDLVLRTDQTFELAKKLVPA